MPILIRCPECSKALKVNENLAGKKVKCPGCSKPVPVPRPATEEETARDVETVEPVATTSAVTKAPKPAAAAREEEPFEEPAPDDLSADEDAGEGVTARPLPARALAKVKRDSSFVPCPKCGATGAKRVKWTFWGSFYGPALLSHVRCPECRYTYNGRTGGSNKIWAAGCLIIPAIGILLLLSLIGYMVWYSLTRPVGRVSLPPAPAARAVAPAPEWPGRAA